VLALAGAALMAGEKVFISHAVADKALVDALVDLLQTGCNLTTRQIFASSIQGVGIEKGARFEQYIQKQLRDAALVIEVLTPSFLASQFCLCELGGQWALGIPSYPLVVPPLAFGDLKAVLVGREAGKIDNPDDLAGLRDVIDKAIDSKVDTARWNAKANAFLEKTLPPILAELPQSPTVPMAEHIALKKELSALRDILAEREALLKQASDDYEQLKQARTREEVADAVLPQEEEAQLQQLARLAKEQLAALPVVMAEVLFMEMADRLPQEAPGWRPDPDREFPGLDRSVQDNLLIEDNFHTGFYRTNRKNRRVKRAVDALQEVMDWQPSDRMREAFEEAKDVDWDSTSRQWWESMGLI
jgi:hypothetical protein